MGLWGQGQWPADLCSPAMFGHVHTQCEAHGDWLEYRKDERGQEGFGPLQEVVVCVCLVGMATWSITVGPLDLPWNTLPSPRCAALVSGLFVVGQEGGITPGMIPYYWACQAFRLGLVLLAGSGFILLPVLPPLIPLMSSYSDHQIATIHILSKMKGLCWIWCKGDK